MLLSLERSKMSPSSAVQSRRLKSAPSHHRHRTIYCKLYQLTSGVPSPFPGTWHLPSAAARPEATSLPRAPEKSPPTMSTRVNFAIRYDMLPSSERETIQVYEPVRIRPAAGVCVGKRANGRGLFVGTVVG